MDARADRHHHAPVRVLPHIKQLDDCFGDFLVRVVCGCGACREIQPQALARLVGWKMTLKKLRAANALLDVREESCRGGGGCRTETALIAQPESLPFALILVCSPALVGALAVQCAACASYSAASHRRFARASRDFIIAARTRRRRAIPR
jgi:hypothetical protein